MEDPRSLDDSPSMEDPPSLDDLPLDSLHQILSVLPPKDVLSASRACKRIQNVASTDLLWSHLYARDFPSSARQMLEEKAATSTSGRSEALALAFYRDRTRSNARWRRGEPLWSESLWEAHHGPIFGVTLLQDPFPRGWILSAGVEANQDPTVVSDGEEVSEMVVWERTSGGGKRHVRLLGRDAALPPGMAHEGVPLGANGGLGGLFHCTQLPGSTSVLGCSFDGDAFILDLHVTERSPGSAAAAAAAPAAPQAPPAQTAQRREAMGGDRDRDRPALGPPMVRARLHRRLLGHLAPVVSGAAYRSEGGEVSIATASFDGTIRLWSVPPAPEVWSERASPQDVADVRCLAVLSDQPDPISPESQIFLLASNGLPVHVSSIFHSNKMLVSGHNDCLVRLWDLELGSKKPTDVLSAHRGWVWSVCNFGDEKDPRPSLILSGGTDSKLCLWDLRAQRRTPVQYVTCVSTSSPAEPAGPLAGLTVRPDRSLVLTNSFDGCTRIHDPRMNLRSLATIETHISRGTRIDCNDDLFVSASFDATIKLSKFR